VSATYDPAWGLTPADRLLVEAKRWGSRLRFAVMLVFFRARGRFPRTMAEMDEEAVAELSRTLGVPASGSRAALLPDDDDRTLKRQRAEIRALLGFREATVADAEDLGAWLRNTATAQTRDVARLTAEAEARCRALHIEPPTPSRVAHIVRGAVRAHDDRRLAAVHARLAPEMRNRLDALLQATGPKGGDGAAEDEAASERRMNAPLIHLRAGPGRATSQRAVLGALASLTQRRIRPAHVLAWSF